MDISSIRRLPSTSPQLKSQSELIRTFIEFQRLRDLKRRMAPHVVTLVSVISSISIPSNIQGEEPRIITTRTNGPVLEVDGEGGVTINIGRKRLATFIMDELSAVGVPTALPPYHEMIEKSHHTVCPVDPRNAGQELVLEFDSKALADAYCARAMRHVLGTFLDGQLSPDSGDGGDSADEAGKVEGLAVVPGVSIRVVGEGFGILDPVDGDSDEGAQMIPPEGQAEGLEVEEQEHVDIREEQAENDDQIHDADDCRIMDPPLQCDLCPMNFETRRDLKAHSVTHSAERVVAGNEEDEGQVIPPEGRAEGVEVEEREEQLDVVDDEDLAQVYDDQNEHLLRNPKRRKF